MNNEKQLPSKASRLAMQVDERGVYVVRDQADELRVAEMLLQSGAVNQTLKTATHVVMALQAAKSLGLNPYTALRQIGFVNGSLMLYGDLELAVVRASGKLKHKEEFLYCLDKDGAYKRRAFANSNLHLPVAGAVCRMSRLGEDYTEEASFSVEDAKLAGLWGRTPTWRAYPGRMLQMRARGLCIRNMFSDVTQGAASEYDLFETEPLAKEQGAGAGMTGAKAALEKLRKKQGTDSGEAPDA
jgi:hypothetical protein